MTIVFNPLQAISDEMSRQKGLIKEKMEAKRLLKENKEYEDLAAKTVMKLAKEQHSRAQEGVKKEQRKQSTLVMIKLSSPTHTCHTSHCETISHRILALLDPVSKKIFKSHRIFIPFNMFNKLFFEELEINHTLAWLSQA